MTTYQDKVKALRAHHEELLTRKNEPVEWGNGIYEKYKNPILTARAYTLGVALRLQREGQSIPHAAYHDECNPQ